MAVSSELQELTRDGNVVRIARFVWRGDGPVEIEGLVERGAETARHLTADGIRGLARERLTLDDGLEFMRGLQYAFRGSLVWATPAVDEETGEPI
jgi:hypothetical protein